MQNIKIIKELGSGGNGTAYLVNIDGKKLIYKIEKLDVHDKDKIYTSEYLRQVKFDDDIAQYHPDKFMILKGHGVIKDCKYVHPATEKFKKLTKKDSQRFLKRRNRFLRKNKQNECYYLIYSPFLDGSFQSIRDKIINNKKLYFDYLYQMINIINILHTNGYSQNDYNTDNIMYKKKGKKYQWYLIDYGQIWHKSFPVSQLDIDLKERDGNRRNNDLFNFLFSFLNTIIYNKVSKDVNNRKLIPIDEFFKNIKDTPEFEKIKKLKTPKKKDLKNTRIHLFIHIYPNIFLKYNQLYDKNLIFKYNNNDFIPSSLRYYIFNHINNKNYNIILKRIKAIM
jgi:hypothetical protein